MDNWKLDVYYSTQLVSGENAISGYRSTDCRKRTYLVGHVPVCRGTLIGTILEKNSPLCKFAVNDNGDVVLLDQNETSLILVRGDLNYVSGELTLEWSHYPGESINVVLDYEYECGGPDESLATKSLKKHSANDPGKCEKSEPEPTHWKTQDGRKIPIASFKTFFSHEEIMRLVEKAEVKSCYDFNTALGNTIKEKYESIYVSVVGLNRQLLENGAAGLFWIVCNEDVASIFETATAGFWPVSSSEWDESTWANGQKAQGIAAVEFRGVINARWRLYVDHECPRDLLLLGANDWMEADFSHYGVMKILNCCF